MKIFYSLILLSFLCTISARIADQYCGKKNCYTLLNVTKDASQADIKKSYRAQSLKYHPDKNPDKDTTPIYREINRAYEILSNEELRKAYDDYLENPDQSEYYQYYKYYKAVYAPQTDPKLVVALFLFLFSLFQYVSRHTMYKNAAAHVEKTTKFQTLVNQRFEEEKARNPKITKDDIVEELRKTVQIHGGYSPPKVTDLLAFRVVILPYTIGKWIYSTFRWIILFWILRKPYGPAEKEYLTRRRLGLNEKKWSMIPAEEREALVSLELWIEANMTKYLKDMQERQREMYADNAKYKQYQRFMKNKKYR